MKFDPKLHTECPQGYKAASTSPSHSDRSHTTTSTYNATGTSQKLYGLEYSVTGLLQTRYNNEGIFKRIEKQDARVHVAFHTTYEGYERAPGQTDYATIGSSQDPQKKRFAGKLRDALARRFNKLGYQCSTTDGLQVLLNDNGTPPLQQMTEILEHMRQWTKEWEDGKEPLGNIRVPNFTIKPNLHNLHHPDAPFGSTEQSASEADTAETPAAVHDKPKPEKEKWEKKVQPTADKIIALARDYFSTATPVKEVQYSLFADALAEANIVTPDKVTSIVNLTKKLFPVGHMPNRDTHNLFKHQLEKHYLKDGPNPA